MSTKTVARQNETVVLFRDLDKPSLNGLSYALRHPDTWPKGFYWDYSECETCAMGLAHRLWSVIPETTPDDGPSVMAREFALPYAVSKSIFVGGKWTPIEIEETGTLWWKKRETSFSFRSVTPEMVADQIDIYLASAE